MAINIKELPEAERPYEKLELYGAQALSNAELLAIIIKTGTKDETSVQVSQKILCLNDTQEEGLNFLRNMEIAELTQIKGIGRIKAIQLKALSELAIRMAAPSNYKKVIVKEPYDLAKIIMEELRFQKREIAKIAILNNKNEILKIKNIAIRWSEFCKYCYKRYNVRTYKDESAQNYISS